MVAPMICDLKTKLAESKSSSVITEKGDGATALYRLTSKKKLSQDTADRRR
jgi:hypothetical protein